MRHSPYQSLENRFRRLFALRDAEAFLTWDLAAMMPPGGADSRAEQLAQLRAVQHNLLTTPDMGELIEMADGGGLTDGEAANLGEMRAFWRRAVALPEDLVTEVSRANSACETAWRAARPASDFAAILPHLERVLARIREKASILSEALGLAPYDALLDAFWSIHNPTTLNRQGPDIGSQYRSAVFFHDADQEKAARAAKERLDRSGRFQRPIVTEIAPAGPFWRAEEYHQRYHEKHGGHCAI